MRWRCYGRSFLATYLAILWDRIAKKIKKTIALVLFHPASRASLDQIRFLGNCPPTPPLTHLSGLKSHVSEKHGLREWWVSSFPDRGGEKEALPEPQQATNVSAAQTSGLVNLVFCRQTGF